MAWECVISCAVSGGNRQGVVHIGCVGHNRVQSNYVEHIWGVWSWYAEICECNRAENAWGKKLGLIGIVLACPGCSVVPGKGWIFHIFFFKRVKYIHTCHALRHIGDICGWVRSDGNDTSYWPRMSHP
jgi:hypothetical protein